MAHLKTLTLITQGIPGMPRAAGVLVSFRESHILVRPISQDQHPHRINFDVEGQWSKL